MCWWTAIDNSMKPVKGQMRLGRLQGFRVNPCSALKPRHTQKSHEVGARFCQRCARLLHRPRMPQRGESGRPAAVVCCQASRRLAGRPPGERSKNRWSALQERSHLIGREVPSGVERSARASQSQQPVKGTAARPGACVGVGSRGTAGRPGFATLAQARNGDYRVRRSIDLPGSRSEAGGFDGVGAKGRLFLQFASYSCQ